MSAPTIAEPRAIAMPEGRAPARRMSVLVVSDVDPWGKGSGAERLLAAHCLGLAKRGHTVHLIAGVNGRSANAVEEVPEVPVHRYRRSLGGCWAASRLFRALARRVCFDVVIFHQPFGAFGVLLARKSRVIPKVYMFLSPWAEEYAVRCSTESGRAKFRSGGRLLRRGVERLVLRASRRIFVASRFMAARLRMEHPRLNRQVALLPGGVDLDRFRPAEDRAAVKAALGLPIGSPVLLTVRNLEPRMGIDLLLHATKKVAASVKDLTLIIGGEGPMGEPLRELARRLGLDAVVRFAGYIPEERLPLFYQAADFFVLPSKELEGFGLVAVEALACGTPVLGTPVGAIPEILAGLSPALLFESTDPEAIAEGIMARIGGLRADPQGYELLRRRCRDYAGARFGWDRIIDQLEQELLGLAAASGGRT